MDNTSVRRQHEAGTLAPEVEACSVCTNLRDEPPPGLANEPVACLFHSGQIALLEVIDREHVDDDGSFDFTGRTDLEHALLEEQLDRWCDLAMMLFAWPEASRPIPQDPNTWGPEIETIATRLNRIADVVGWIGEGRLEPAIRGRGWYNAVRGPRRFRYYSPQERLRALDRGMRTQARSRRSRMSGLMPARAVLDETSKSESESESRISIEQLTKSITLEARAVNDETLRRAMGLDT